MKTNTHVTPKIIDEDVAVKSDVLIKTTKDRIYDWIYYMCTHHNIPDVKDIPIMITREYVATRYSISIRQVERIINSLIEDKKIYRYKTYNNIYIYSITPQNIAQDLLVRVRLS